MTTTIRSSVDGSKSYIQVGGTDRVTIGSQGIEAGSYTPGSIVANNFADGALIENSVNGIGYGVGAGGTVTQATSKSTSVTLNKPCGQITMHNASLAAGAQVTFGCINSLLSSTDVIVANIVQSSITAYAYRLDVWNDGTSIRFILMNISGLPYSDAVKINFAIIKGATS